MFDSPGHIEFERVSISPISSEVSLIEKMIERIANELGGRFLFLRKAYQTRTVTMYQFHFNRVEVPVLEKVTID